MDEPLLGQIELFPYSFEPEYWALCNGRLLFVEAYKELFKLLGAKYGGDGENTFALPNLLGTEPIPGLNYYMALKGVPPSRP